MTIRKLGMLLILISAFVSLILAASTDMSHQELGALVNYIWPPVIGLLTLILFYLISFLIKNVTLLKIVLAFLCLYNIYVGLALHLQKDYWPFVTF